ncbi:MAG: RagB/SusD family nutrient uptake outer membrane protein [Alistipes sp.]
MKNSIYKLGLLAALLLSTVSCSFLETEPHVMTPENFYKSEKEVNYGLAGVYGAMSREEFYGNYFSLMISNADDLCYYNRERTKNCVYFYNHDASDPYVYDAWTTIYAGIKNANEFMYYVADSPFDKDAICYNEARFLRAYYHFLLAEAWGNVPMRTTRVLNPNDTQLASTAQEKVLEWCVSEMEAIAPTFPDALNNAPSRLTRASMEGILARVCLFTAGTTVKNVDSKAYYAKAAKWAGEVIKDARIKLNPSYSDVFINMISDKYDRDYNESMWEVDFLGDRSNAQSWTNGRIGDQIGLQSNNSDGKFAFWTCNYSYAMYNGSLKLWDLYYKTDRATDENETIKDVRQAWNMPPYNYFGLKDKGVYIFRPSYEPAPYTYMKIPSFEGTDPSKDTGNAVCLRNAGKWRRESMYEGHKVAKSLYTAINFPLLRYADVLLMYAEAVNELNGAPDDLAKECVKKVRERAGIKTDDSQLTDDFRELVRNERGRELAFEGVRKFDLIRWGTFVKEMNDYSKQVADPRWVNDPKAHYAAETGSSVRPKHIYLPIPSKELGVNKLLRQNPLW